MSSVTSTESQPLEPWQFFTLAGLIGATIVVFLAEGQSPAGIILLSVVIFAASVVGVAAWRMFAPLAGREEPTGPQIFGGRTRAALEREKTLVLRAIKDLEFDHAMGKVSEKDFAEMGARLRARAAGLMRQLDAGTGYRDAIRREIEKRIGPPPAKKPGGGEPAPTSPQASSRQAPTSPQASSRQAPTSPQASSRQAPTSAQASSGQADVRAAEEKKAKMCQSCCTMNDPDARFCKGCGYHLGDW